MNAPAQQAFYQGGVRPTEQTYALITRWHDRTSSIHSTSRAAVSSFHKLARRGAPGEVPISLCAVDHYERVSTSFARFRRDLGSAANEIPPTMSNEDACIGLSGALLGSLNLANKFQRLYHDAYQEAQSSGQVMQNYTKPHIPEAPLTFYSIDTLLLPSIDTARSSLESAFRMEHQDVQLGRLTTVSVLDLTRGQLAHCQTDVSYHIDALKLLEFQYGHHALIRPEIQTLLATYRALDEALSLETSIAPQA